MQPLALSVTIDKHKMKVLERAVAETPRALPKIMVRSLKRTAAGGRTELDRQIRSELTVKKKAVMERIVDEEKPSYSHWVARLGISGRRLSVASFRYRWSRRKGVTYSIKRGVRKAIPRGFVRSNPNADGTDAPKVVFRRKEVSDVPVARYPLIVPRGPSLGQALTDAPEKLRQVERTGRARLEKEITGQINLYLRRRWPK
jgi:hypothetical protein